MTISSMIRGYFDGLVEPMFQRDEQGRELFFPFGLYSRGRIVPDVATGQRIRTAFKVYFVIMIATAAALPTLAMLSLVQPWTIAGLAAGLIAMQFAFGAIVSRRLARADRRMTIKSQIEHVAAKFSTRYIRASVAIGLAFTIVGIVGVFAPALMNLPTFTRPVAALVAVFFGAVTLMWIAIANRKRRTIA